MDLWIVFFAGFRNNTTAKYVVNYSLAKWAGISLCLNPIPLKPAQFYHYPIINEKNNVCEKPSSLTKVFFMACQCWVDDILLNYNLDSVLRWWDWIHQFLNPFNFSLEKILMIFIPLTTIPRNYEAYLCTSIQYLLIEPKNLPFQLKAFAPNEGFFLGYL